MTATNIMTTTSMSRMVLLAFVAAGGIPLVLAIQHFRREPPIDTKAATAAPGVSKPASGAQDQSPDALAAAQAKADAVAAALAGSPVPPGSHDDALSQGLAWNREAWKGPLVQRRAVGLRG
jgi:hypothetical protein